MYQNKLFLLFCFLTTLYSAEITPFNYPLFKQCNQSWGANIMGSDNDTICQVGCLMTSVSMALNGHSIQINGTLVTPAILNKFLQQNNGYADGSDLIESAIPNISPSRIQWIGEADSITRDQIISALQQKDIIVIAHVLSPEAKTVPDHFVLVVGYDDKDASFYYVNDSGFKKTTYELDKIRNWRIFWVQ